jgi:hypothetical protein
MLLCCATTFDTTAQTVRVVERTPSGGYIVSIDGVEMRAITSDEARRVQETKINLAAAIEDVALLQREISLQKNEIELLRRDTLIGEQQTKLADLRAARLEALWQGEERLRTQAEKLMRRGRVTTFFDNPYMQFVTKIGFPALNSFLKSRCG